MNDLQSTPAPPSLQGPQQRSMFEPQSMLSILVIVMFAITFVVQAFRVPSESMEKTLLAGDFLLADKVHLAEGGAWSWILPYRIIQRGDIIVFHYPVDPSTYFVKRVIGIPGDRIHLQNKLVYVNGAAFKESYAVRDFQDRDPFRDNFPREEKLPSNVKQPWRSEIQQYVSGAELVVPAGRYFVMGDNRDQSLDSRYWGFVPRSNIMGRPLVIYLSVRNPTEDGELGISGGKLLASGQMVAHFRQLARWDRMFRLVH
jgi:signal peptidase I